MAFVAIGGQVEVCMAWVAAVVVVVLVTAVAGVRGVVVIAVVTGHTVLGNRNVCPGEFKILAVIKG